MEQVCLKRDILTSDEIYRLAGTFVSLGVNKIRLTGGEPLVRKDAGEIIHKLSEFPVSIAITTNGVYIDRYIDILKKNKTLSVNVSLDTLVKDKFQHITKHDSFNKVIANIELLKKENIPVKLNVVLLKGINDNEIVDFIEWTKCENMEIRFIEFMPFKENGWQQSGVISFNEAFTRAKERFGNKITAVESEKNSTARKFRIDGYRGTFAFITSVSLPFCESCNRLRITSDGKLKNCLFSKSETDLLTPLRNGENIVSLIMHSVKNKSAYRGGMQSMEEFSDPSLNQKNRSMIMIGG